MAVGTEGKPRYLIGAGVAAALVAAAVAGWLLFFRGRPPSLADDEARDLAAAFLADLRAGRVDAAWAGTAADFKSAYGRDRFRAYVRSKPALKSPAEFQACDVRRGSVPPVAECAFRPTAGAGAIKVVLTPEAGRWKVGKLSVD